LKGNIGANLYSLLEFFKVNGLALRAHLQQVLVSLSMALTFETIEAQLPSNTADDQASAN